MNIQENIENNDNKYKLDNDSLAEIQKAIYEKTASLVNGWEENNELLFQIIRNKKLAIQSEEKFYQKVLTKIIELYIHNQENIILFDLDETIVNRDSESGDDYVRTSFFDLYKFIKSNFDNIDFWILSSRGKENLDLQLESWSLSHIKELFNGNHIYSSREIQDYYFENDAFNPWKDKSYASWHVNKSNAFHKIIVNDESTNYILVDDVIDPIFEKLWHGIVLWKDEMFVYPDITGIKK